jgi:hypothetical protein
MRCVLYVRIGHCMHGKQERHTSDRVTFTSLVAGKNGIKTQVPAQSRPRAALLLCSVGRTWRLAPFGPSHAASTEVSTPAPGLYLGARPGSLAHQQHLDQFQWATQISPSSGPYEVVLMNAGRPKLSSV